jgi:hypothetical protein
MSSDRLDIFLRFSFSPTPIYTFLQLILVWACGKLALLVWLWDSLSGSSRLSLSMSRKGKAGEEGGVWQRNQNACIEWRKRFKTRNQSARHFPIKGLLLCSGVRSRAGYSWRVKQKLFESRSTDVWSFCAVMLTMFIRAIRAGITIIYK